MTILDQSADRDFRQLHRHLLLYGAQLPEALRKEAADHPRLVPPESKPQYYADPRSPQQFPCHTKVATAVSYLYYLENRDQVHPRHRPRIEERFQKFAEFWQITNLFQRLAQRHGELHKEAELPDSEYALVYVTDGSKQRHCRLANALEVKVAAAWFAQYLPQLREQLDFTDRQTVASKILEKSAKLGADIGEHRDLLERCAGRGLSPAEKIAAALRFRSKAGARVSPATADLLEKLAQQVALRPLYALDPETRLQLAETIDQFDRAHGLLNKYASQLPPPEEVVFEVGPSQLGEVLEKSCALCTGNVYSQEDFQKLSLAQLEGLFGPRFSRDVAFGLRVDGEKLAAQLDTLSLSETQAFEDLLREAQIRPLAKQAGTRIGFTPTELLELARQS